MPGQGLDFDDPNHSSADDGPIECLGKTFENDAVRREHYLGLLAEKLKDPEFRKIEGFPIGEDEDILNLSDPPYYTACPNPFIEEYVAFYGRPYDPEEDYKREPYAADVSEGKSDPVYNAHSYHTKVPHKAILRYILHYTSPGDVILDAFCGTGMTGVAASYCDDREVIESLGYRVDDKGIVYQKVDGQDEVSWEKFSEIGPRNTILGDLSPAATFISANYNSQVDSSAVLANGEKILAEVEEECGWMYKTKHEGQATGRINYVVWSDIFQCSECSAEINLWMEAVDEINKKVLDSFSCPSCGVDLNKKKMDRVWRTEFDPFINKPQRFAKQEPTLINYSVGKKRFSKYADEDDVKLVNKIKGINPLDGIPLNELPTGVNTRQPIGSHGIDRIYKFYTTRNAYLITSLRNKIPNFESIKAPLTFWMNAANRNLSKMSKLGTGNYFHGGGGAVNAGILGTLYIPSFSVESSVLKMMSERLPKLARVMSSFRGGAIITTQSSSLFLLPDSSVDYIFLDPPFGSNINYSELNFLWEAWLKVHTNISEEAIENSAQKKGPYEYRKLMTSCFKEAYRLLKPGRWLTVEFSNTKSSVWNSIQQSLSESGFIVGNVSALDKKLGSFKAVTTPTAVKQDLVISAYKPNGGFEERFRSESGEESVWDFIRTHLGYIPVYKLENKTLNVIADRDPRILFDQMVSYFVRNSRDVPLSSKEFQEGLLERFSERDGMIFLPEQIVDYDKVRMSSKQLKQLSIFVDDEASAIEWLRQLLNEKPQNYQDIHPKFINELSGWKKAEAQLELSELLDQNFLEYEGEGLLPPQIHSYLSTNFKEFRNLKKGDVKLLRKAKNRWYVPNPDREEDLQKLRERSLLIEFEVYKKHTGKKLKKVRMESVRCGFKKAWRERDYLTIISVAEKIPQDLLQGDQKLLMWYDQAQTRQSDENLF